MLVLWGDAGIPAQGAAPLDVWREWAVEPKGAGILGGHFLPEENPEATLAALEGFL